METAFKTLLVNLSDNYGLIAVSGPDAINFLQGQFTLDIRDIGATRHGLGAYCTPKGRIRALCRFFFQEDIFYLQLPSALLPTILRQLTNVARFSKIKIEDLTKSWKIIGFGNCDWADTKNHDWADTEVRPYLMEIGTVQNLGKVLIARLPHAYPRFEVLGPIDLVEPFWDFLKNSAEIRNFDAWKCLDIEAKTPEVWAETTECYLPHTLALPALGAVSFNKGCYCGQEIIARMEYRGSGKSKRHLSQIILKNTQTVPIPGTPIYNEAGDLQAEGRESIGTIVTAAYQEIDNCVLALIEKK